MAADIATISTQKVVRAAFQSKDTKIKLHPNPKESF
jgi:hypothetical protein